MIKNFLFWCPSKFWGVEYQNKNNGEITIIIFAGGQLFFYHLIPEYTEVVYNLRAAGFLHIRKCRDLAHILSKYLDLVQHTNIYEYIS